MRDNFAHSSVQRDLQDLCVVFQIDPTGWLQPEIMAGAGLGYRNKLIAML